jgi:sec-independent protein translocase protein TatA
MMGPIGVQEMLVIFVLALLLFGPKKLPELGRMLGKGLSEFKKAKSELRSTFESHMQELERETRLHEAPPTTPASSSSTYSSASYPYPYDEYGRQDSYTDNVPASASDAYGHTPAEPVSSAPAEPPAAVPEHSAEPVSGTVPRSKFSQPIEP